MESLKGYRVFDLETTITPYMGRKASPFTDENWVVAAGRSHGPGGGPAGDYFGSDKTAFNGWFANMLRTERPKYLVGFNIKFDILYSIRADEDYEAYQEWIVDGGELWDTQLAEYLLDGQRQESHMLSLDEVAPRYGGTLKIDEVKAMWAQGINTDKIPRQLLMDYLLGRDEDAGDIGNTELIFIGQVEAAKKAGQAKSIRLNNGALVATIEMERNGLAVNTTLGRQQASKLLAQSISLTESLKTSLPEDLPFEFNWRSRKQISALIFGGRVPYQQRVHLVDEHGALLYAMMDVDRFVTPSGEPTDDPTEADHYIGGKKKGLPKSKRFKVPDHTRPKLRWETFEYAFPGYTTPKKEWETSEPGVYKTGEDIIDDLGGRGIEFLDRYADLKDIVKDLGTYYITEEFDEEGKLVKAKGMLTLVHKSGRVHANISMVSTVTGRFAHSQPNVGNLPRSDTSDVKQMFESRWGEDGVMISSDFSSLEVYCQANLSHDKQLIADLLAGMDMHVKRLAQAEGKTYEEVFLWTKIQEIKEWVTKRKNIKVFSFQRAYGAGAPKIARGLKLSVDTVAGWIVIDDEMYPGIVQFNERVAAAVKQSRVPEDRYALHPTAKVKLQLGYGVFKTFDGKRYVFKENPSPDFMLKRGQLQGFSPTELKNYPVQGLGGEIMKAAMWLAVRSFYRYKNFGGLGLLVNTVHDADYADAHKSVQRKVGVLLHATMLAASDFMEYWFSTKLDVPVPSETTWGSSMYEEKKFDDKEAFEASAQQVRAWLRDTFMEGYQPSYLKD